PVVFAFGFEPTEGPGLLFIVLPAAFAQLPFGQAFLAIFLLLFLFATLTSSFSLYEIIVSALKESGVPRAISAIFLGFIIFFASFYYFFSFCFFFCLLLLHSCRLYMYF